jgi:hypothetical protein
MEKDYSNASPFFRFFEPTNFRQQIEIVNNRDAFSKAFDEAAFEAAIMEDLQRFSDDEKAEPQIEPVTSTVMESTTKKTEN